MSGLFGIGGGIIVTPLLVLIYPIVPMAVANFFASLHADAFSENFILFVFGLLGLMSLLVTYLFHKPVALLCNHQSLSLPLTGLVLGVLCGLVGQGGGFALAYLTCESLFAFFEQHPE